MINSTFSFPTCPDPVNFAKKLHPQRREVQLGMRSVNNVNNVYTSTIAETSFNEPKQSNLIKPVIEKTSFHFS